MSYEVYDVLPANVHQRMLGKWDELRKLLPTLQSDQWAKVPLEEGVTKERMRGRIFASLLPLKVMTTLGDGCIYVKLQQHHCVYTGSSHINSGRVVIPTNGKEKK